MKFFQYLVKPTHVNINKGSIKLIREEANYFVKYPELMNGDIKINQVGKNVTIELKNDFSQESSVVVNLNGLPECNVYLNNGLISSEYNCPTMKVKIDNGNLFAKISKFANGIVKAHVDNGLLTNNSDLAKAHDGGISSFFSMYTGMNMQAGLNNNVELTGTLDNHSAIFEVGSGSIDLY